MTIALTIVLAVTVAGFLILLDRKDVRHMHERRELANRIQFPDRMPVPPPAPKREVERTVDEIDLVNVIQDPS